MHSCKRSLTSAFSAYDYISGLLRSNSTISQAVFVTTDVNDWKSQCHLFEHAFQTFGSIDYVCANAGIPERGPWIFEDILDSSGELQEPDLRIIDINLKGVILSTYQ